MDRLRRILAQWPFAPLGPLPTPLGAGGQLRRPLRAVLFDVYGTLLISRAGDISLANGGALPAAGDQTRLASRLGLDAPLEQIGRQLEALILDRHASLHAAGIDVPEVEIDRIWMTLLATGSRQLAREAALVWELTVNPVWPMPGTGTVLDACRRAGLVLGIVSNAQFFTPLVLERLLGADLDDLGFAPSLRIFSYRLGRAKPSPVLFETAAGALHCMGIEASSTLYVGNDMRNDVWAAGRAGFQTALFAGDARSLRTRDADGLCGASPDLVINDLNQLLDHLPILSKEP